MKKRIAAKTVNGNVIDGFVALFEFDMFAPDTITISFPDNIEWKIERTMLLNGGDFGGDIAIVVDEYDTVIGITEYRTGKVTPIVFDTMFIREFIQDSTLGVDIPKMREAEVDNFIVQFYSWNEGLV